MSYTIQAAHKEEERNVHILRGNFTGRDHFEDHGTGRLRTMWVSRSKAPYHFTLGSSQNPPGRRLNGLKGWNKQWYTKFMLWCDFIF
jgi:hypothetical protein